MSAVGRPNGFPSGARHAAADARPNLIRFFGLQPAAPAPQGAAGPIPVPPDPNPARPRIPRSPLVWKWLLGALVFLVLLCGGGVYFLAVSDQGKEMLKFVQHQAKPLDVRIDPVERGQVVRVVSA